jgi:predicted ATP-grasp superfamily ATP-dependent carboligase
MGPRVLLLDASLRQSLAACRALGRARYDVGLADHRNTGSITHSRFAARFHRLPDPHGPEADFKAALTKVVNEYRYAVLIATDDATLARLAHSGSPIPSFPSTGAAFKQLTDKVGLAEICARADVSYPETFKATSPSEAERLASELDYPLVVKGARSAEATTEAVRELKGAVVANDRDAALKACAELSADGLVPIIQKRVRKAEKLVIAIVRRGEISEMRFATRVLREFPRAGGIGSALESIAPNLGVAATALDSLERVLDAVRYEGLASAECIVTAEGEVFLIEVNPRLWGSLWFAENLRQRVAERGVRVALGETALPQVEYPSGHRFHHMPSEWRWVWQREHGRVRALFEVASSLRPWDIYDYVNFSDPLPLVGRLLPSR